MKLYEFLLKNEDFYVVVEIVEAESREIAEVIAETSNLGFVVFAAKELA